MKNPETKRRRGGQPGNTNAVKSGRYTAERRADLSSSIELCRVLYLTLRHIGARSRD